MCFVFCHATSVCPQDYVDAKGRRVGDEGFVPPTSATKRALPAGCYDDGYRDANGRRPGDVGFVPPLLAQEGKTAADMQRELPSGYDRNYRDAAGRKPGDKGFVAPTGKPFVMRDSETGLVSFVRPVAAQAPDSPRQRLQQGPHGADEGAVLLPQSSLHSQASPHSLGQTSTCTSSSFNSPHSPQGSPGQASHTPSDSGTEVVAEFPVITGYTAEYVDTRGLVPGQKGFQPPVINDAKGPKRPLPAGGYDRDYIDAQARRPGNRGFVPPLRGITDPVARAEKAAGLAQGYDQDYRDSEGRCLSDEGFIPPVYTQEYVDPDGHCPGEQGFMPPVGGGDPMDYGAYNAHYRDREGRKPGEEGFEPPLASRGQSPREGYDEFYRDARGHKVGNAGFLPPTKTQPVVMYDKQKGIVHIVPKAPSTPASSPDALESRPVEIPFTFPVYTDAYVDDYGRKVGETGFMPPGHVGMPLPEGGYTDQYRDRAGRKPGERGFVPPKAYIEGKTPEQMALELPQGFDEGYFDSEGRQMGHPDFRAPAPRPTDGLLGLEESGFQPNSSIYYQQSFCDASGLMPGDDGFMPPGKKRAMEAGTYDDHYVDPSGKVAGEPGFVPPGKTFGLLEGYDEFYRDPNGFGPSDPRFTPPKVKIPSQGSQRKIVRRRSTAPTIRRITGLRYHLDSVRRPIGVLLDMSGKPIYYTSAWPAVVWSTDVGAHVAIADTMVDDVASANPDLLVVDRSPLTNLHTGRPLSLKRARRIAHYLCDKSANFHAHSLDPVTDVYGDTCFDKTGRPIFVVKPKEWVRAPDGSKVLDATGQPISQHTAQRYLGIPPGEAHMWVAEVEVSDKGQVLYNVDGSPQLRVVKSKKTNIVIKGPSGKALQNVDSKAFTRGELQTMAGQNKVLVLSRRRQDAVPARSEEHPMALVVDQSGGPVYDRSGWPMLIRHDPDDLQDRLRLFILPDSTRPHVVFGPQETPLTHQLTGLPLTQKRAAHTARFSASVTDEYEVGVINGPDGHPLRDVNGNPVFQRTRRRPGYLKGPEGSRLLDANGKTITASQAERMAGITWEDINSYTVELVLDDDGLPVYSGGNPVIRQGALKEGKPHFLDAKGQIVCDAKGKPLTEGRVRQMMKDKELVLLSQVRSKYFSIDDDLSGEESTESDSSIASSGREARDPYIAHITSDVPSRVPSLSHPKSPSPGLDKTDSVQSLTRQTSTPSPRDSVSSASVPTPTKDKRPGKGDPSQGSPSSSGGVESPGLGLEVAYLGLRVVELAQGQVRVPSGAVKVISAAGPAARAGILPQDLIAQINEDPVPTLEHFRGVTAELRPGVPCNVHIERNHRKMVCKLTPVAGERRPSGKKAQPVDEGSSMGKRGSSGGSTTPRSTGGGGTSPRSSGHSGGGTPRTAPSGGNTPRSSGPASSGGGTPRSKSDKAPKQGGGAQPSTLDFSTSAPAPARPPVPPGQSRVTGLEVTARLAIMQEEWEERVKCLKKFVDSSPSRAAVPDVEAMHQEAPTGDLSVRCYGPHYRDAKGRKPGDPGFVPPLTGVLDEAERQRKAAGLLDGYDGDYRDENGHWPGSPLFMPPCYNDNYTDANGRHPGEAGFLPPGSSQPLNEGMYDANYRDINWRRPGDRGFIPPMAAKYGMTAEEMAVQLPIGYDDKYVDPEGRVSHESGFIPPHQQEVSFIREAEFSLFVRVLTAKVETSEEELQPYTVLRVGNVRHSSTIKKSRVPEWNETFQFENPDLDTQTLDVALYSQKTPADVSLGKARVNLAGLKQTTTQALDIPLMLKGDQGQWVEVGKMQVLLELRSSAPPKSPPQPRSEKRLRAELIKATGVSKRAEGWYVKLTLGGQVKTSSPKEGTPLPQWNELFEFDVIDEARETLNITLLDESDTTLGLYRLKFDNMPREVRQEVVATLLVKRTDGQWAPNDPPDKLVLGLTTVRFGRPVRDKTDKARTTAGSAGLPVGYTAEYQDPAGRSPGVQGFVPPATGYAEHVSSQAPLDAGCYDEGYTDALGRQPGDSHFIPPLQGITDPEVRAAKAKGLADGYDMDYRDANRAGPLMPGFIPPCYTMEYVDPNGRHVGSQGFIPPLHRHAKELTLPHGCYDENYRDGNGRRPGEVGFVPVLQHGKTAQEMEAKLPKGYDEFYRDPDNNKPGAPQFVPPRPYPPTFAKGPVPGTLLGEPEVAGGAAAVTGPTSSDSQGLPPVVSARTGTEVVIDPMRAKSPVEWKIPLGVQGSGAQQGGNALAAPAQTSTDAWVPTKPPGKTSSIAALGDSSARPTAPGPSQCSKPGEERPKPGYVPPLTSKTDPTAKPPDGSDSGSEGSGGVAYTADYRDENGKAIGEEGFISPVSGQPLPAGSYDSGFRDEDFRKPGDPGFKPPVTGLMDAGTCEKKTAGLETGYDEGYVDLQGRQTGEPGFEPPGPGKPSVSTKGSAMASPGGPGGSEFSLAPASPVSLTGDHMAGDASALPPLKELKVLLNQVTRIEGRGVSDSSAWYVRSRIGANEYCSQVKNGSDPMFHETFGLRVSDEVSETLDLSLINAKTGEVHGQARVGLGDLLATSQPSAVTLFVQDKLSGQWVETATATHLELEPIGFGAMPDGQLEKQLTVEVIQAACPGIPPGRKGLTLTLKLGQHARHTTPKIASAKIRWKELFRFPVGDATKQTLDLTLRDGKGEVLGMHRLKIDGLRDGVRQEVGATLHVKKRGKWVIPDLPTRLALGLTVHGLDLYNDSYVDAFGRSPGEIGFVPPLQGKHGMTPEDAAREMPGGYDANYRDRWGRKPGSRGFQPPAGCGSPLPRTGKRQGTPVEKAIIPGQVSTTGTYGSNYNDSNGRRPGELGFVPPRAAAAGMTASEMGSKMPEGYDEFYRDEAGRKKGEPGFRPPCYTDDYRDAAGRRPGDDGFISPVTSQALAKGAYDLGYRDSCWRKPGDTGFTPPGSSRGLPEGYDQDYVDELGRKMGDASFTPPKYDSDYADDAGRRAGEEGFVPPGKTKGLGAGEYDENYCDQNQKRPGEEGFIPPMQGAAGRTAEEMRQLLPKGYDDGYRDVNGKRKGDPGFIPPQAKLPLVYDSTYTDPSGKQPGEVGFAPPVHPPTDPPKTFPTDGAYDAQYRDDSGKKAGDSGFVPPLHGITDPVRRASKESGLAVGWDEDYYDPSGNHAGVDGFVAPSYTSDYVDSEGRRPGEQGFLPPGKTASMRMYHAGEYDSRYRDQNGRQPGEPGFIPPMHKDKSAAEMITALPDGYDMNYVDPNGHKPGQPGFQPPKPPGKKPLLKKPGKYDASYRDENGRKPGDRGFIPPLAAADGDTAAEMEQKLPQGYDENYVDSGGRSIGDEGFRPPSYTADYVDGNGHRPGEAGFMPPTETGKAAGKQLGAGEYDEGYRDANFKRPGEPGFIPPERAVEGYTKEQMMEINPTGYDDKYRDRDGNQAEDDGFLPPVEFLRDSFDGLAPACGGHVAPAAPLAFGTYTGTYRDVNGRRPGELGFVPPRAAAAGMTASEFGSKMPEGYDEFYRDEAGRKKGEPGFRPPCYTDDYRDAAGRRPGDDGFISPVTSQALAKGAYDLGYRDSCWRKPGDTGFTPPGSSRGLPEGYDQDYVDELGRKMGDASFTPPKYDSDYADDAGRRAGEEGFVPPGKTKGLGAGEYDENYCDQNQKRPGEEGFIPPMQGAAGRTAEEMRQLLPKGYDDGYRDVNGKRKGDPGFIPPQAKLPLVYDSTYTDPSGKQPGEVGFAPPVHPPTDPPKTFPTDGAYDAQYRDDSGKKAGDSGFVPPLHGITDPVRRASKESGLAVGWDEDYYDSQGRRFRDEGFIPPTYTSDYVDSEGRRPGEQGFLPPGKTASMRMYHAGEYDSRYRDQNGRQPGEPGFIPPMHKDKSAAEMITALPDGYDMNYVDPNGHKPGQPGFQPPKPPGKKPLLKKPGKYDASYRDENGRKPGDRGFIPPLAAADGDTAAEMEQKLPQGYDENYVDSGGRSIGDEGFRPPSYTADYVDGNGHRPGEAGFMPPTETGKAAGKQLGAGEYDEGYRDANFKRPGEPGFIPPERAVEGYTKEQMMEINPTGYDDKYRDRDGNQPIEAGFVPPSPPQRGSQPLQPIQSPHELQSPPTDPQQKVGDPYPQPLRVLQHQEPRVSNPLAPLEYSSAYRDQNNRQPGEPGFIPPQYANTGKSAAEMALAFPGGYDRNYVDSNGLKAGQPGFVTPRAPLPSPQKPGLYNKHGQKTGDEGHTVPELAAAGAALPAAEKDSEQPPDEQLHPPGHRLAHPGPIGLGSLTLESNEPYPDPVGPVSGPSSGSSSGRKSKDSKGKTSTPSTGISPLSPYSAGKDPKSPAVKATKEPSGNSKNENVLSTPRMDSSPSQKGSSSKERKEKKYGPTNTPTTPQGPDAVQVSPAPYKLHVHLLGAKFQRAGNIYTKLTLGDQMEESTVQPDTEEPTWDMEFVFAVQDYTTQTLDLAMYDLLQDRTIAEMGKARVSLNMDMQVGKQYKMPLMSRSPSKEWLPSGEVQLFMELRWAPVTQPSVPMCLVVHEVKANSLSKASVPVKVKMHLGGLTNVTRLQMGPPKPVWLDLSFRFPITDMRKQTLDLSLVDNADKVLGMYRLKIDGLTRNTKEFVPVSLLAKDPKTGEWISTTPPNRLTFALTAEGFGKEPPEGAEALPGTAQDPKPATPHLPTNITRIDSRMMETPLVAEEEEIMLETAELDDEDGDSPPLQESPSRHKMRLYDYTYRDKNGRRPGDKGFIPPLTGVRDPMERAVKAAGLEGGYDMDYRDRNGRAPCMPGFLPPSYSDSYTDPHGRHPGDPGFVPPTGGHSCSLKAGQYDRGYVDPNGLRPGEPGFMPPTRGIHDSRRRAAKAQGLPEGFDEDFRDHMQRTLADAGFIPPQYSSQLLDNRARVGDEGLMTPAGPQDKPRPLDVQEGNEAPGIELKVQLLGASSDTLTQPRVCYMNLKVGKDTRSSTKQLLTQESAWDEDFRFLLKDQVILLSCPTNHDICFLFFILNRIRSI